MERLVDDMTLSHSQPEQAGISIILRHKFSRPAMIGPAPGHHICPSERSRIFATEQYRRDGVVTLKVMGAVDAGPRDGSSPTSATQRAVEPFH
jgi:hypothetical protein